MKFLAGLALVPHYRLFTLGIRSYYTMDEGDEATGANLQ